MSFSEKHSSRKSGFFSLQTRLFLKKYNLSTDNQTKISRKPFDLRLIYLSVITSYYIEVFIR